MFQFHIFVLPSIWFISYLYKWYWTTESAKKKEKKQQSLSNAKVNGLMLFLWLTFFVWQKVCISLRTSKCWVFLGWSKSFHLITISTIIMNILIPFLFRKFRPLFTRKKKWKCEKWRLTQSFSRIYFYQNLGYVCVCAFKCAAVTPVQQDKFKKGLVEFCVECQTKCHHLAITIRKTKSDQWNFIPAIKLSPSTYNSTIAKAPTAKRSL